MPYGGTDRSNITGMSGGLRQLGAKIDIAPTAPQPSLWDHLMKLLQAPAVDSIGGNSDPLRDMILEMQKRKAEQDAEADRIHRMWLTMGAREHPRAVFSD